MMLVCALLAASLCVITGAQKAHLNTNQTDHNVCDSHCAVEDLSAVTTKFSRQVTVKKARVVNFTISIQIDSKKDPCQNTSLQDFSLIWAVDEMEPYLYLPSDFLKLSCFFAPEFRHYRMNIRLNCTRVVRRAPHDEPRGISLLDAAIKNLMQDLTQTSEGTLCLPLESQEKTNKSYKCCQLDKSTSEIMCNVVHSKFVRWFRMLDILEIFIRVIILWYLPAVFCIFPDLPKVSKDGIRCIKLEDPSPASFCSLVVKACVSQHMPPLLYKTRDFLFKVVLYPCMFALPLIIAPGFDFNVYIVLSAAPFYCAYAIKSIIDHFVLRQEDCNSECYICKKAFSQSVIHSSTADAIKAHMTTYPFICMVYFHKFHFLFHNWFKSHVYSGRLRFNSPEYTIWSVCRIFCFAVFVFLLIAIPMLIFESALILAVCLALSSPIGTLVWRDINLKWCNPGWDHCDFALFGKSYSHMVKRIYLLLLIITYSGLQWCTTAISVTWATALPFSIMAAIDYGDTALPMLALLFLILYYLYSCFTSFSEKYQLLKIKLCEGIQQYHVSKGSDESEDSFFVYTINGAMAIPEDLYEAACKELRMSIMEDLWVAFMKIVCFMVFVGSVYISITIFGARSGLGPVTKAVAIFLAGFFPKLLTVLSDGDNEQTLQEFEMEKWLKTVITRYAHERTSKRNESRETTNDHHKNYSDALANKPSQRHCDRKVISRPPCKAWV